MDEVKLLDELSQLFPLNVGAEMRLNDGNISTEAKRNRFHVENIDSSSYPLELSNFGEENYERKKGRAKLLRKEISSRFDELQLLLLKKGSLRDITSLKEKVPKRSAILDAAIATIDNLSSQTENTKDSVRPLPSKRKRKLTPVFLTNAKQSLQRTEKDTSFYVIQHHAVDILSFLDFWSVLKASLTCVHWYNLSQWDLIWSSQCVARWKLTGQECAFEFWKDKLSQGDGLCKCWKDVYITLHRNRYLPHPIFPLGRSLFKEKIYLGGTSTCGVNIWAFLCCRSNGMTTRAVILNNSIRSAEIVEIVIYFQYIGNQSDCSSSVNIPTDSICVKASPESILSEFFTEMKVDERFSTKLVSRNGFPVDRQRRVFDKMYWLLKPLRVYDTATLRAFLSVPGCLTETSFLYFAEELLLTVDLNRSNKITVRVPVSIPIRNKSTKYSVQT